MPPQNRRSSAETKTGNPCRAWAVHDSDPPLCAIHGSRALGGPPAGNRNAVTHGFYADSDLDQCDRPTINAILNDLAIKQTQLSELINACLNHLTPENALEPVVILFKLHGQNASRLGRLLRDRLLLGAADPDRFQQLMDLGFVR